MFKLLERVYKQGTRSRDSGQYSLHNLVWLCIWASRVFGSFPIRIQRGEDNKLTARFAWASWLTLYSLGLGVIFNCLLGPNLLFLISYMPKTDTESWQSNSLDTFCKWLFVISHCSMWSLTSLVLVPAKAAKIATFWNRLRDSVDYFQKQQVSTNLFRKAFIKSLAGVIIVCLVAVIIALLTFIGFRAQLENYYLKGTMIAFGRAGFLLYLVFPVVVFVVTGHLVPSALLICFAAVLLSCYESIQLLLSESKNYSRATYMELLSQYGELEALCFELSNTYGLIMIFQLTIMLVSSILNIYFLIYVLMGMEAGYHPLMAFFILPAYFFWLWVICDAGESINICAEKVRYSLITFVSKLQVGGESVHGQLEILEYIPLLFRLSSPAPILTASTFCQLNMRLMTSILAAIITYLILMIQFNASRLGLDS